MFDQKLRWTEVQHSACGADMLHLCPGEKAAALDSEYWFWSHGGRDYHLHSPAGDRWGSEGSCNQPVTTQTVNERTIWAQSLLLLLLHMPTWWNPPKNRFAEPLEDVVSPPPSFSCQPWFGPEARSFYTQMEVSGKPANEDGPQFQRELDSQRRIKSSGWFQLQRDFLGWPEQTHRLCF